MTATATAPRTAAAKNTGPVRADGFGKIVCFHPRFQVGAQHEFAEPRDFLAALVDKAMEAKAIVDYVLSGRCKGLELQYCLMVEGWDLIAYDDHTGNWDVVDTFANVQDYLADIAATALAVMSLEELYDLAREENALLPVFMPGAASPFLQTSLNAPHWSAGQIGWAYADRCAVNRKYHGTKEKADRLIKAEAVLQAQVEACANPRHKRGKRRATV